MAKKKPVRPEVRPPEDVPGSSSEQHQPEPAAVKKRVTRGKRKSQNDLQTSCSNGSSPSTLPPLPVPDSQLSPQTIVSPQESLDDLGRICKEIVDLARQRTIVIKSRLMQANRLQSIIAHDAIGYNPQLSEKERTKAFEQASELIKEVVAGKEHKLKAIILTTAQGIQAFDNTQYQIEKQMRAWGRRLPKRILDWLNDPSQNGCSLEYLAVIIGETGDLRKYAAPGKVWKRMGTTPKDFQGRKYTGSTLRIGSYYLKDGKQEKVPSLPKEEWESFGYCPRRRSVAYILGENLVRQNYATIKRPAPSGGVVDSPSLNCETSYALGTDQTTSQAPETSTAIDGSGPLSLPCEASSRCEDRHERVHSLPGLQQSGFPCSETSQTDAVSTGSDPSRTSDSGGASMQPETSEPCGTSFRLETSAPGGANGAVSNGNETSLRVPGPYRLRYEECRDRMSREQPGYAERRYHRNGMLRATNLFLKNLWVVWNAQ